MTSSMTKGTRLSEDTFKETAMQDIKEFLIVVGKKMSQVAHTNPHARTLLDDLRHDVLDDIGLYGEDKSDRLARASKQFDEIVRKIDADLDERIDRLALEHEARTNSQ